MLLDILLIIGGLAVLIAGAEALVRGAASLAAKLKVSALIIGLTVVSFGTSAPELTVNIAAALSGSPDLAIGNVIGSNIANILLILGVCALITPLTVKSSTVWKEIPLALLGISLIYIMGNDRLFDGVNYNTLTRTDGIVLMSLMAIFMYYIFGLAKSERADKALDTDDVPTKTYGALQSMGLLVAGLAGLIIGGHLLVDSAIDIAQSLGVSEGLIGLTIVGIGTSLPELATSVVAALRGKADIAIGNAIGSNIFNTFWILGATSTILQLPFNVAASVDVLVAVGVTAALFGFMFLGKRHSMTRIEGGVFVASYFVYLCYLVYRG